MFLVSLLIVPRILHCGKNDWFVVCVWSCSHSSRVLEKQHNGNDNVFYWANLLSRDGFLVTSDNDYRVVVVCEHAGLWWTVITRSARRSVAYSHVHPFITSVRSIHKYTAISKQQQRKTSLSLLNYKGHCITLVGTKTHKQQYSRSDQTTFKNGLHVASSNPSSSSTASKYFMSLSDSNLP